MSTDQIKLSQEERTRLRLLSNSGVASTTTRLRCFALLMSEAGLGESTVAHLLGVPVDLVCEARAAWQHDGLAALEPSPMPSIYCRLDPRAMAGRV